MKPEESIGRWISLIHRQGQIYLSYELKPYKIGSGQISFLMILYQKDGLHQEEISRLLNMDKATTTRAIRKLEEEGYVRRERDFKDKRAYKVFLTERGKKIKNDIRRVLHRWTSILSFDFTEGEKKAVRQLLARMHKNALQSKYSKNPHSR